MDEYETNKRWYIEIKASSDSGIVGDLITLSSYHSDIQKMDLIVLTMMRLTVMYRSLIIGRVVMFQFLPLRNMN
ncbi:hypothetical protein EPI10_016486 [Gossypium australe]|uniref:Uncharacterized protein n=1 Tax=Gossypium australe TaxID=47621 RepID=A0A5B6VNV5_9ROSI|nr:hypothetical protein EPI10_016486 [Gossypium australe]